MGRTNDMFPVLSTEYGVADQLVAYIREAFDTPIGHRQKDEFVMLQPYEQSREAILNKERRDF
jgi:hypothetical protein